MERLQLENIEYEINSRTHFTNIEIVTHLRKGFEIRLV
jgi:hypothetical protein